MRRHPLSDAARNTRSAMWLLAGDCRHRVCGWVMRQRAGRGAPARGVSSG